MSKARSREETINNLADKIDRFEKYKQPHSTAMSDLARHLARRFGLSPADVQAIAEATRLHDIGLYAMSPAYYAAPGELQFEDRLDLWRHSIIGEQEMAKREASRHAQLLVRWHHEAWNGSGYPDKLAFEDIPVGARIMRAVELYNSLTADRPYRQAYSSQEALRMLKESAGVECDPYVVDALLALLKELEPAAEQTAGIPAAYPQSPESPALPGESPTAMMEGRSNNVAPQPNPDPWQPASPALPAADIQSGGTLAAGDDLNQSVPPAGAEPVSSSSQTSYGTATGETTPVHQESSVAYEPLLPAPQQIVSPLAPATKAVEVDDSPNWRGWRGSRYNGKTLLGFEVSVLRQLPFDTIAIAFSGEAKLDWYLKILRKRVFSNDSRAWAAACARAAVETGDPLTADHLHHLLQDVYIPGARLANPHLCNWFRETDAWWLENLRRNIFAIDDERLRAQAFVLGMQTGDYALSFNEATVDLRRPLSKIFMHLAERFHPGAQHHPQNRSFNLPPQEFLRQARADLLYLNLPPARTESGGAEARSTWRECWVTGEADDANDATKELSSLASKNSYLHKVDEYLRAASHVKRWAIGCQEIGLTSARDLSELIKEHRQIRATYSKDVSEVAGGLRSYIIVADKG